MELVQLISDVARCRRVTAIYISSFFYRFYREMHLLDRVIAKISTFDQPGLVYLRFLRLLKIVLERFISIERHRDILLQVSWVRHRDIHLLTVGRYTYTSDQRFEALHLPHAEEWTLRIRYPQQKDSGIYECQISTTPPIGHPVYLTIVGKLEKTRYSLRAKVNFDL